MNRALRDMLLLEVVNRVQALDRVDDLLRHATAGDERQEKVALQQIEALLLSDPSLSNRFNNAVSQIAAVDPVLAYRLRSKDAIPRLLSTTRALTLGSESPQTGVPEIEALVRKKTVDDVVEVVLEVSALHGWRTKRKVRQALARRVELLNEFEATLIDLGFGDPVQERTLR